MLGKATAPTKIWEIFVAFAVCVEKGSAQIGDRKERHKTRDKKRSKEEKRREEVRREEKKREKKDHETEERAPQRRA